MPFCLLSGGRLFLEWIVPNFLLCKEEKTKHPSMDRLRLQATSIKVPHRLGL